ncbi:hypothetical protein LIER_25504 [Lithospermum erythrorhizon]|uniref:Retroviral polymerase SH3-like domain-containing protein n=1 Tax=Lithospermum erythrorhizon TaxID=34254 RepID=A0AAV3R4Z9_LITER
MPHETKLDHKAMPGVFIGYPQSQKAYKIYDLSTSKVVVSRDVSFYEHIFPFSPSFSSATLRLLDQCDKQWHKDSLPKVPIDHDLVFVLNIPNYTQVHDNAGSDIASTSSIQIDSNISSSSTDNVVNTTMPRQSTRNRQTPSWFRNYIVSNATTPASIPSYSTIQDEVLFPSLILRGE